MGNNEITEELSGLTNRNLPWLRSRSSILIWMGFK